MVSFDFIYGLDIVAIALSGVLIPSAWVKACRPRFSITPKMILTSLVILTISFLWFLCGWKWQAIFGVSYSHLRYFLLEANWFAAIIAFLAAILGPKHSAKPLLVIAGLALAFVWTITIIANSVV